MATVLFAWQLGAGLGHMMQTLPLAAGLAGRGHSIYMALRNVSGAGAIFWRVGIRFLQAPAKNTGFLSFADGFSFAHLLANIGFGSDHELFALASAWRNLFLLIRPDLIVFDHSPVALLAARGISARRALIGSGFCCPPDVCPLPVIRPRAAANSEPAIVTAEERILQRVNRVLRHWRQPPLERLGRLYGEVDECFLTTFPELDHYPFRTEAQYRGPINAAGGEDPEWPVHGRGKRVFAYLKRSASLPALLGALKRRGNPTLVYPDGIDGKMRKQFESETLRFQLNRPDPKRAARECEIAVSNGSHGTTCDVLLAGKPILQIPLQAEQELGAEAVCRLGAGRALWPGQRTPQRISEALDELLEMDSYSVAAQRFAERYAAFDFHLQREEMLERACVLAAGPSPPVSQAVDPRARSGQILKSVSPVLGET
jgi:hypothetical protein